MPAQADESNELTGVIQMKSMIWRFGVLLILTATLLFCTGAIAIAEELLAYPVITETDCEWDENGNLIRETAHDLNGAPAMNSRGFYRAVYSWDRNNNLLTEAYFDTEGNPAVIDRGYARAEYTYYATRNGTYHVLTEDRFDAEGIRADIPGEYSYRRDAYEKDNLLSSKYYNANGELTRPNGGYAQIVNDISEDSESGKNVIIKHYLDADGSPLIGIEGGEVVVSVYTTKA